MFSRKKQIPTHFFAEPEDSKTAEQKYPMINTLDEYFCCSLSLREDFDTNLRWKVDAVGNLLPFAENTAVFLLDDDIIEQLQ